MTRDPGLPLTTGEGNTAQDAARRLLAIDDALHPRAEGTTAFKRTDVRLVCEALAECGRLTRERDVAYDQKAMLHDSLEAAREQLDAARRAIVLADEAFDEVTLMLGSGRGEKVYAAQVAVHAARAALGVGDE